MDENPITIAPNNLGKVTKSHNPLCVTMINDQNDTLEYPDAKSIAFATRQSDMWQHIFQIQYPTPLILCSNFIKKLSTFAAKAIYFAELFRLVLG